MRVVTMPKSANRTEHTRTFSSLLAALCGPHTVAVSAPDDRLERVYITTAHGAHLRVTIEENSGDHPPLADGWCLESNVPSGVLAASGLVTYRGAPYKAYAWLDKDGLGCEIVVDGVTKNVPVPKEFAAWALGKKA